MAHGFTLLQRFQQRKYIKYKLVKTEERGWGLLADADIKVVLSVFWLHATSKDM